MPSRERPVWPEEAVERAARACAAYWGVPYEGHAVHEYRKSARAVLSSVDAVPRWEYDSLAEMFEAVNKGWDNCEAQARAYRETLEQIAVKCEGDLRNQEPREVARVARAALGDADGSGVAE